MQLFTAFLHFYTFLSFAQHDQVQLFHFFSFSACHSLKKLKSRKVFVQFPDVAALRAVSFQILEACWWENTGTLHL
jgi:hypothetical protein